MAFPQGIDFRGTSGFVTDPANCTFEIGNFGSNSYPRTTPQGNTVGWAGNTYLITDRSASVDARLAGINYQSNAGTVDYRIDLPSTGSYQINLALGDIGFSHPIQLQLYDNTSLLATIANTNVTSGNTMDATGTIYSDAAWPGSNTPITKVYASTIALFRLGYNGAQADNSTIQHIFIQAAGGFTPKSRRSLSARVGTRMAA